MPGTYSQILLHAVFSTKHRQPSITPDIQERLYPYIGGLIRAENGALYQIGGIEDHIHLYFRWRPDESVSALMRTLKSRSTKKIRAAFPARKDFAWQEGFAAFSVSKSQEIAVKNYIAGQREHHAKVDFRNELLQLLRLHDVPFEEKYVFD